MGTNIIKLYHGCRNEGKIVANGLAPIIGYEPWALRTVESIKQTLCDNVPVLIRVHPAADYPCNNAEDAYRLDIEAHSILIIGFDDESREFDVVNPWNKEWGGQYGGIEKMPYDEIPITCVNASYGKVTRLALPKRSVVFNVDENGNASLHLSIGYYTPSGYIIDQKLNRFTNLEVKVSYDLNGEKKEYFQSLKGEWPVGEIIETDIPIGKRFSSEMNINFEISLTLEGKRPYAYEDTLSLRFDEKVYFVKNLLINEEYSKDEAKIIIA